MGGLTALPKRANECVMPCANPRRYAGIQLASAVGGGAAKGLESAIGSQLAAYGVDSVVLRKVGVGLAAIVAFLATMVVLGVPIRWILRPLTWPLRLLWPGGRAANAA